MKPTKILHLIVATAVAAIVSYLLVRLAVGAGFKVPVSGLNLILTLPIIGAIVLLLAIPIIRYRRSLREFAKATAAPATPRPKRVDPFYAVRVLLLAKATAIAGSLFAGWHLGTVAVQASQPVIADSIWLNVAGLIGSALMAAAGVITERICKIPDAGNAETNGKSSSATEASPA
jgi:hypothetical protein